jgi:hypothetical protein
MDRTARAVHKSPDRLRREAANEAPDDGRRRGWLAPAVPCGTSKQAARPHGNRAQAEDAGTTCRLHSKVRVARVPVDFSLATSTSCTTTPSLPVHSKHQLQHCVVHLRLFLSNFQSRVPVFMAKWNFALSFSPFLLQFQAETVLLLRTRQTELRSFALSVILYHTICALLLLACK